MPVDEKARLAALRACGIMDTPREAAFDNIVFTAAQLFRAPIALLALVDDRRAWAKALVGRAPQEQPRATALCAYVVDAGQLMVVEDTTVDARFAHLRQAADAAVRFFAGAPLLGPGRHVVGALGVIDHHPRAVPERQQAQLMQLALEAGELLRIRVLDTDLVT